MRSEPIRGEDLVVMNNYMVMSGARKRRTGTVVGHRREENVVRMSFDAGRTSETVPHAAGFCEYIGRVTTLTTVKLG